MSSYNGGNHQQRHRSGTSMGAYKDVRSVIPQHSLNQGWRTQGNLVHHNDYPSPSRYPPHVPIHSFTQRQQEPANREPSYAQRQHPYLVNDGLNNVPQSAPVWSPHQQVGYDQSSVFNVPPALSRNDYLYGNSSSYRRLHSQHRTSSPTSSSQHRIYKWNPQPFSDIFLEPEEAERTWVKQCIDNGYAEHIKMLHLKTLCASDIKYVVVHSHGRTPTTFLILVDPPGVSTPPDVKLRRDEGFVPLKRSPLFIQDPYSAHLSVEGSSDGFKQEDWDEFCKCIRGFMKAKTFEKGGVKVEGDKEFIKAVQQVGTIDISDKKRNVYIRPSEFFEKVPSCSFHDDDDVYDDNDPSENSDDDDIVRVKPQITTTIPKIFLTKRIPHPGPAANPKVFDISSEDEASDAESRSYNTTKGSQTENKTDSDEDHVNDTNELANAIDAELESSPNHNLEHRNSSKARNNEPKTAGSCSPSRSQSESKLEVIDLDYEEHDTDVGTEPVPLNSKSKQIEVHNRSYNELTEEERAEIEELETKSPSKHSSNLGHPKRLSPSHNESRIKRVKPNLKGVPAISKYFKTVNNSLVEGESDKGGAVDRQSTSSSPTAHDSIDVDSETDDDSDVTNANVLSSPNDGTNETGFTNPKEIEKTTFGNVTDAASIPSLYLFMETDPSNKSDPVKIGKAIARLMTDEGVRYTAIRYVSRRNGESLRYCVKFSSKRDVAKAAKDLHGMIYQGTAQILVSFTEESVASDFCGNAELLQTQETKFRFT